MTLHGKQPINPTAPVGHVSFFEADAFARWSGHRLPTEAEWEVASTDLPPTGNTLGQGHPRPLPAGAGGHDQMFGDLWNGPPALMSPTCFTRRPASSENTMANL